MCRGPIQVCPWRMAACREQEKHSRSWDKTECLCGRCVREQWLETGMFLDAFTKESMASSQGCQEHVCSNRSTPAPGSRCTCCVHGQHHSCIQLYEISRRRNSHVVARLLNSLRGQYLKGLPIPLLASTIIEAENFCIKSSMVYSKPEMDAGKLQSLREPVRRWNNITAPKPSQSLRIATLFP